VSHHEAPNALWIAQRFRGPHRSGNGGYTAGALAQRLLARSGSGVSTDRAVCVTLRLPPPLETPLEVSMVGDDSLRTTTAAGAVIAQAQLVSPLPAAPPPVSSQTAAQAGKAYRGYVDHPFPFCFSCGTDRAVGDALRLFAGPVPEQAGMTAALWQPGTSFSRAALDVDAVTEPRMLTTPVVWAALDCPGAWAADFDSGRPLVLGRMTAVVHHELPADEPYVVVGKCLRQEGRKAFTTTGVYDQDSRLMAAAEAIWLAVDPATFAGLQ